jgi:hypothetical protein
MSSAALSVRSAATREGNSTRAGAELGSALAQPNAALTVVFASARHDLEAVAQALKERVTGPIVGCSTAGEIGPEGYSSHTVTGFSLASPSLEAHPYLVSPLASFDPERLSAVLDCAREVLVDTPRRIPGCRAFGFLLVDGLSGMEEHVVALLGNGLPGVPIVGGSAGDDLEFRRARVLLNGRVVDDAAVFVLVTTSLPFSLVKTQHFAASEERVVVTRAAPERRIVYELNGRLAAEEYARLSRVPLAELSPGVFSAHPLMLRFGGEYYVRSVQRMNADGSLSFFCAIDEGVVLRLGHGDDLVKDLHHALAHARAQVTDPRLTIGFDCILRRLEVEAKGLEADVNRVLREGAVIGFSTYGEQFGCLHVNQTFTGVCLGEGR